MSVRNLEALFHPGSVAVIGASDREGSVGTVVLRNLKLGGFKGAIWPVNRRHAIVDGGPAWSDVASLPQAPDLAIICTPAKTVPGLIAALGHKGTRAAIVLSAGLKDVPASGGPSLEQAMLEAARPHLLRILGPNCIGVPKPSYDLADESPFEQGLEWGNGVLNLEKLYRDSIFRENDLGERSSSSPAMRDVRYPIGGPAFEIYLNLI